MVRRRGRPLKLSRRQVGQARCWARLGWSQQPIADWLRMAQSVISELLGKKGVLPAQELLPGPVHDEPVGSVGSRRELRPSVCGRCCCMPIWTRSVGRLRPAALKALVLHQDVTLIADQRADHSISAAAGSPTSS